MRLNLAGKITIIGLLILATFGCQDQATSNSINSNVVSNNTNSINQTNGEIPSPQNIKFESAGKVEIVGTFYESPKTESPAVLLLHQFGSDRQSFDEFAKRLQKKGFGVLAIDGRGFGESVKTTDGKTVAAERTDEAVKGMKADVSNAFDLLVKQKNVDPLKIGIVGASYGSSLALIYGSQDKIVKAVALLSPGLNYFGNMPTESAIKKYGDRPLLLVAAADDKEPAEAVKQLKSAGANDKYETKIFEKGGHGTNIFDANVGLQDLLEQFLTKSLAK
jgi:dienelactone hydrolase